MAEDKTFSGYVGIKKGGNRLESTYVMAGSHERVKELIQPNPDNTDLKDADETHPAVVPNENSLQLVLDKALDAARSLSALTTTIAVSRSLHTGILKDSQIISVTEKYGEHIEDFEGYQVFGLDGPRFSTIFRDAEELTRIHKGYDHLPAAVFMSIVSVFDSLLVELVEKMITIKPDRINASSREISVSEVLKESSLESFRQRIIDDEIYSFSRGSHEEQVKYIERVFSIEISAKWKRWPDFIEIFERRNLVAHGIAVFNTRYAQRCSTAGHKGSNELVGKGVQIQRRYLVQSLNVLFEFYGLLVFSIWRKLFKNEEADAFSSVNEFCFGLIYNDLYVAPARIIEFLLGLNNADIPQSTRLMMTVNLASTLIHNDEKDRGLEILDSVDWSTCSPNYQICVAALREDVEEVLALMPYFSDNKAISKFDYRNWPVFDFVRSNDEFRKRFSEIYGEDILIFENEANDQVANDSGDHEKTKEASNEPVEDDKTVH